MKSDVIHVGYALAKSDGTLYKPENIGHGRNNYIIFKRKSTAFRYAEKYGVKVLAIYADFLFER